MKKVVFLTLLITIFSGCTVAPVEEAVQTAIAKTASSEDETKTIQETITVEGQITFTPTELPTDTPIPTESAEEWFLSEAKISSFYIFEAGENPANAAARDYAYSFVKDEAKVIYCDLDLAHPAPEEDKTFTMEAVYYGPDDGLYGQVEILPIVETGWSSSNWIIGYGWDDPGNWDIGRYRVEVLVGGQVIASDAFDIVEFTPTPEATLTPTPRPGAVVDANSLNIRSGPDTVYSIVGSASKGDWLEIIGQAYGCGWLKIMTEKGVEGWVSAELVIYEMPCSDIPAATIPPTPIPLPTSTPIPLPTFTPTTKASQGKTVAVKIINNTGGTLTLNLSGPATYSFTFTTGTHTIQVVPGTYTYTAWGCGATATGTKKLSKGDEWTWFCE